MFVNWVRFRHTSKVLTGASKSLLAALCHLSWLPATTLKGFNVLLRTLPVTTLKDSAFCSEHVQSFKRKLTTTVYIYEISLTDASHIVYHRLIKQQHISDLDHS